MVALNSTSKVQLIHAVKACIANTKKYKAASVPERIDIITVEAIAIMHNMNFMTTLGEPIERDYSNKETFKDIYSKMKNKYIVAEIQQQLLCYHEDKVISAKMRAMITTIRELIIKINDTEKLLESPVSKKGTHVSKTVLMDKTYDFVTKELKMKSPTRSKTTFLKDPAKFVKEISTMNGKKLNTEVLLKLSVIKAIIGASFVPKSKVELYVSYVNGVAGTDRDVNVNETRYKEYMLNNYKIIPHMVFKLRMAEMNAILIDHIFTDKGFNAIVNSVYDSCVKAKELGIHSYLQVTNLIMNNIIVEALTNTNVNKDLFKSMSIKYTGKTKDKHFDVLLEAVGAYVEHNYKNKYSRVYAYSVESAIQKAISFVNTFEDDAFSDYEYGEAAKAEIMKERKDA